MAFALGNTFVTSAYQIANTLPNAIYDLVAGGLLGAAFIPVFLLQKEKFGQEGGNRFAGNILNLTIVVMGLLSILATVFAPQVVATQTFTVGSEAEVTEYAVLFFQIFAAQIVFYGIGGVVSGVLNANRIYFLPALAPALNNIAVIVSLFRLRAPVLLRSHARHHRARRRNDAWRCGPVRHTDTGASEDRIQVFAPHRFAGSGARRRPQDCGPHVHLRRRHPRVVLISQRLLASGGRGWPGHPRLRMDLGTSFPMECWLYRYRAPCSPR